MSKWLRMAGTISLTCVASTTDLVIHAQTSPRTPPSKPHARTASATQPAILTIDGTLEAALGQPRIVVQVSDGSHILAGEPGPLDMNESRPTSFLAYLDTGASGHMLSKSTARRFGIKP